jgi:hypothetical protein
MESDGETISQLVSRKATTARGSRLATGIRKCMCKSLGKQILVMLVNVLP